MQQLWVQANIYAKFMITLFVASPIMMILIFALLAKAIRKTQVGGNRARA